ncbi:cytochrome c-550 [Nodosilinea sp. LEGE 07088]|uniref:photosystem II cytochrome c-550 n=1 Tax=Nodosilinea sp. LEGE 07088 TaxID=2777968 RepID=UPI0018804BBD|nr:photosystem II cytochrome c-550 [Nodosilinea sp. LEGE 07088]MBE9138372.1 cytochrome c-550 [Nodosilinea sp. LEGE 07088]
MAQFFEKFMPGRILLIVGLAIVIAFQIPTKAALAIEISESARTVPLNASGDVITLTEQQLANGRKKFNGTCSACHLDGITKPNPDISLAPQTLALALPARDNLEGIIDYLKNPTTYDGLGSLEELHPSTARVDLFPRMKTLTDQDLADISGYVLAQPNIIGRIWASGKPGR